MSAPLELDKFMSSTEGKRNAMLRAERLKGLAQPTPRALSGTQQWALDWFRENGPVERPAYRNARITTGTVNSLIKAGLVERRSATEPRWRITYAAVTSHVVTEKNTEGKKIMIDRNAVEIVARWIEDGGPGVNLESTRKLMAETVRSLEPHSKVAIGEAAAWKFNGLYADTEVRSAADDTLLAVVCKSSEQRRIVSLLKGATLAAKDGAGKALPQAFNAFLCRAWGETDLPSAEPVADWEGVRRFMVREWLGEVHAPNDDDTVALVQLKSDFDAHEKEHNGRGGAYEIEFEIGGVSVERVCGFAAPGAAVAPRGQEAKAPKGWRIEREPRSVLALYRTGTAQPYRFEPGEVVHTLLLDVLSGEADDEDILADDAVNAGRTPGDSVPGVSTEALVRALARCNSKPTESASCEEAPQQSASTKGADQQLYRKVEVIRDYAYHPTTGPGGGEYTYWQPEEHPGEEPPPGWFRIDYKTVFEPIATPAVVPLAEKGEAASALKYSYTDGTCSLKRDVLDALMVYSGSRPEEDRDEPESWEEWFTAAFDLCSLRVADIFAEHELRDALTAAKPADGKGVGS